MSGTYSSQFERMLDMYKSNLVQYKVSGNTSFKTAADNIKKWLDNYVSTAQSGANKGAEDIQKFVTTYAKSDEEIAKLKKDLASIRKEGPELQTVYETERESQKKPPVDVTIYYTKGAVLLGVAGLIAVASMF